MTRTRQNEGMTTMETVTVTIGRNVGVEPLAADAWNAFVASTRAAVEAATSELFAVAAYKGSWDGVSEDAALFYGPLVTDDQGAVLAALRSRLAVLASYYGQEGIGLSVGASELVASFADAPAEALAS